MPDNDLAPNMPSREVTISASNITEGGVSLRGQWVNFALSDSIDVTPGGDMVARTSQKITLDSAGNGRIRLPVYDTSHGKGWEHDKDWAIIVTTSWGSSKAIRVPAGSGSIPLSHLPAVRPLSRSEMRYAVTGVGITVGVGSTPGQASGTATLDGGILRLGLTVPPSGPHTHPTGDITGLASALADLKLTKGAPAGANFNTYYTDAHSGHWYFSAAAAAGMSGLPAGFTDKAGSILVLGSPSRVATQIYFPYGYFSTEPLRRTITTIASNTWSPWEPIGGTPDPVTPFTRGTMPLNSNINDWWGTDRNGLWHMTISSSNTVTGLPDGMQGRNGQLLVLASSLGVSTQMYFPYAYYGGGPMIRQTTNAGTHTWSDWAALGGTPTSSTGSGPWTQHTMRQTRFMSAMNGPISTGKKAAVALRFDHGLLNFRDKVLPLVKARGIKVSQAYNPRNWHYPENAGVTATDLNSWVAAGDVEIWNHSASHQGAETEEELYTQIVTGLAEVEAELPAAAGKVWGWCPPGVSTGDYMGYQDGRTPEGWDSYAGNLILQRHAVASGYLSGTQIRPLDGTIRDGQGHYTMDSLSVATIKGYIDTAISRKAGVQLMLHPSQLDLAGKLTTAQFTEILDYIVAKRTAGDLVTLSPYQLTVADSRF
ncbi:hypothetical protein C1N80_06140 [Brachybacterium sp. SGAir0954]|nr:hypothetical protein C1N80_06140 [Brachybacterium sp. SGAir0954]